jgi:hypothetical protein
VTAATRFKAGTDLSFGEKKLVQVKGYAGTIDAYEIMTPGFPGSGGVA